MLPGAAAGFDHVAGFAVEEFLQHLPDRLVIAVKRRRIEPAVRFDWLAILAEFHDVFSHVHVLHLLRHSGARAKRANPESRAIASVWIPGPRQAARPGMTAIAYQL